MHQTIGVTSKELKRINPTRHMPTIELGSRRQFVVVLPSTCVHDHMFGYIREEKTLKEARANLKTLFVANAHKFQLY